MYAFLNLCEFFSDTEQLGFEVSLTSFDRNTATPWGFSVLDLISSKRIWIVSASMRIAIARIPWDLLAELGELFWKVLYLSGGLLISLLVLDDQLVLFVDLLFSDVFVLSQNDEFVQQSAISVYWLCKLYLFGLELAFLVFQYQLMFDLRLLGSLLQLIELLLECCNFLGMLFRLVLCLQLTLFDLAPKLHDVLLHIADDLPKGIILLLFGG